MGSEEKAKVGCEVGGVLVEVVIRPVPVESIVVGEQMLRGAEEDESIVELAADIARRGLLQPIGVVVVEAGGYQLLWGSRRLAAHRRLRSVMILARVYAARDDSVKTVALVENLHRRQLSLSEECDAVGHLHHEEGQSPDQIAACLSVSRNWVLRRLGARNLPVEIRELVFEGVLPLGVAEQISLVSDAGARAYITQQAVAGRLSISQVRAIRESYEATPSIEEAVVAGVAAAAAQGVAPSVHLPCEACGVVRPIGELRVVRVCAHHVDASVPAPVEESARQH